MRIFGGCIMLMFQYKTGSTHNYLMVSKVSSWTIDFERPLFYVTMDNGKTLTIPMSYATAFLKTITNNL